MRRVFLLSSIVAVLGGAVYLHSATPVVRTGSWMPSGAMGQARTGAAAVQLPDGRVMITGGSGVSGALATAELFGSTGSFSDLANMSHGRSHHVSVALNDGRV